MQRRPRVLCSVLVLASIAGCGGGDGPSFAKDHPRIYLPRNRDRLEALVAADAPTWARFKNIVDIQVDGGNIYGFEAWYAALVGQLTGEARYCEYAVGQIDEMVLAENERIAGGENPEVAFDSYLEVGARIGDIALTYDWCSNTASSSQKTRWLEFSNKAVWNVWHHEEANWDGREASWSGWSVDNPSNNYYYSFLRATMMLGIASRGELPEGQEWIDLFRDGKIGEQLIPTFQRDLAGGGSREGTGYGVAMKNLWELYDFWHGSTGEQLADQTGHARASMLHMMHQIVPTLDRIAPIGDHSRDSSAALFDYHRQYLQTLAYLYKDDPMAARATYLLANSSVPEMDTPFMYVYDFINNPDLTPAPLDDVATAYFGAGTGVLFARSGWDTGATWISFMAGPYTESHAHQDQGSFMIYKDGWMAYDGVIDSTSGLTQEPEAHSLLRFVEGGSTVGMREPSTSTMEALHRGPGWLHAAGDLTPSFGSSSPIDRWQREIVYLEPDALVIYDRADVEAGVEQIWQVVAPENFTVSGARATTTGNGHTLTVQRLLPATAAGSSGPLSGDFRGGFAYEESSTGTSTRHLHVLWLDGAVGSATLDTGNPDGVIVNLTGGRTATVRFDPGAIGGSLSITGGAGPNVNETLGAGVDPIPERE